MQYSQHSQIFDLGNISIGEPYQRSEDNLYVNRLYDCALSTIHEDCILNILSARADHFSAHGAGPDRRARKKIWRIGPQIAGDFSEEYDVISVACRVIPGLVDSSAYGSAWNEGRELSTGTS